MALGKTNAVNKQEQIKSVTVTTNNTTQRVDADSGKTMSAVQVTTAIPNKTAQTYIPGTTAQTINPGVYIQGVQTIQGDVNLIGSNIKASTSIFGVNGTFEGVIEDDVYGEINASDFGENNQNIREITAAVETISTPSGSYNITQNGTYTVTAYDSVVVDGVGVNNPLIANNDTEMGSLLANTSNLGMFVRYIGTTGAYVQNAIYKIVSDAPDLTQYYDSDSIPRPTLYAPSISLTGSTLSITDSVNNGIFVDSFKIYVGSNLLTTITTDTYDLSTELTDEGTYAINVKACGVGFNDSVVSNSVNYVLTPPTTTTPYLTFSSPSSFTLNTFNNLKNWDGTLEYSTNTTTWATWNGTTTLSSVNNVLYLRGISNTYISDSSKYFVLTGSNISCNGNIENILDYQTVVLGNHPTMADKCFRNLFRSNTSLLSAPSLPATTLANYCYQSMFYGCTSLTIPPSLPATTLANGCYQSMFSNCTSLTIPPSLPATTLANGCYNSMFYGCTSLTIPPSLPATTLADNCYQSMFSNCTSLTTVNELPALTMYSACYQFMYNGCTSLKISDTPTGIYQYEWRLPTSGTGTTASNWSYLMVGNTGGTYTSDISINTSKYVENQPV